LAAISKARTRSLRGTHRAEPGRGSWQQPKIIVVGGGLAGLAAVIKIAEAGGNVDLFSIVPVKRSHSVCAQGGINAAKNLKGEGDTTYKHFDDTIYGGDFLANQTPVKAMCEAAPGIIDLLDRMGVPFNRTPEGLLDFRRFGGTLYQSHRLRRRDHRPAASLRARRASPPPRVRRQSQEVRRLGVSLRRPRFQRRSRGICAMDLRSMELRTFPADAIIIATGGNGAIFGKSTNSVVCTGSAQSALYQQGAYYANGEFIQVHPTCIPGEDKLRLMSESARGEGGRVWVPKTQGDKRAAQASPSPTAGTSSKSGIPSTATSSPRRRHARHSQGGLRAHGSASTASRWSTSTSPTSTQETLNRKLEGILEIYEKFVGDDPAKCP
jgi:succinate dehydrogenase / fumarate reductase flavoprotein subunit